MPGRLFLTAPLEEVADFLGADPGGVAPDPPRFNIAPGEQVIACPPGLALTKMRWGMIPVGRVNARGRPVMETIVNARSETVFTKSAFEGVTRALVPVNGWYEWTGEKRKKTAWRIARPDGRLLAFAAIYDVWNGPGGIQLPQLATVTCPPSGDVKDIHDRMGVLLEPSQFATWLGDDTEAAAALMRPYPDGSLAVTEATGVDWTAP
ncbi:SOS response-associated peptidase [Psychromarinibacter sp. S121]|uniref:SOS response-associated peptidase n=1 Tax=Psychromarinibacter sp. S121 TaxID=3415127 RepID=UPI003C7D6E48